MSNASSSLSSSLASNKWTIGLWAAQIILAGFFGMAGVMKTFMAPADLVAMGILYATEIPLGLLRFIGVSELAGAIGILLPAASRILPRLTPLAALGFAIIQVLAIGFHAVRGELAMMAPINILLLALSVFVLWGRLKKAPVAPRP